VQHALIAYLRHWSHPARALEALAPDQAAELANPEPLDAAARQRVETLLACLRSRERTMVRLRFGLEDGAPWRIEAIAAELGMTPKQVGYALHASLKEMRAAADAGWEPAAAPASG
jgi:DNA-directed RNA polymerase specialized sigma24 family protein